MENRQCRKFLITINNPASKGYTKENVIEKCTSLSKCQYAVTSSEIGLKEKTPHMHAFVLYKDPKLWSTMTNLFPKADIRCCRGTCEENRNYVLKIGKWKDTEKETTRIDGEQAEYGDMPDERSQADPQLELLFSLIDDGLSDYQIISEYPEFVLQLNQIQRIRLTLLQEKYKEVWRDVEITYIHGKTATGKSRYVMDSHGYKNVFRVTDYNHPFDTYECQDVIIFEEFCSSLKINDMLTLLDGYPCKLPCRYADKQACFTKVYFATNTPLEEQYPNIQRENRETWDAFLRRINKVMVFNSTEDIKVYDSVNDYMNRAETFHPVGDNELPFD